MHDVVQGANRLLDRGVEIVGVDLIEVDVVELQAAEAGVDGGEDMPSRQADLIRPGAHAQMDFRSDDDFIARPRK